MVLNVVANEYRSDVYPSIEASHPDFAIPKCCLRIIGYLDSSRKPFLCGFGAKLAYVYPSEEVHRFRDAVPKTIIKKPIWRGPSLILVVLG